MRTPLCEERRGDLALYALGQLPLDELATLESHLASCAGCRRELVELEETRDLLEYVHDVETLGVLEGRAPRAVTWAPTFAAPARTWRHPRLLASALWVSVATVLVVALVAVALRSEPAGAQRTLALRGAAGAQGVVQLHREPWGTSLTLSETGLAPGHTYRVSMRASYGTWWTAGTYYVAGHSTSQVTMACAAALGSITEVRVETTRGVSVLRSTT